MKTYRQTSLTDPFNSFLVRGASFEGELEIPKLKPCKQLPSSLVPFSKIKRVQDFSHWVHFYEYDLHFESIWSKAKTYTNQLKKFQGIITPDFSVYQDLPLVHQYFNIYRSRAIGHHLQAQGINVIPNIRFGDERTFRISCLGIPSNSTIAFGSLGSLKSKYFRNSFFRGVDYACKALRPQTVIIYGGAPSQLKSIIQNAHSEILHFESDVTKFHKQKQDA